MAEIITREQFDGLFLKERLGDQHERAVEVFETCGVILSLDVTTMLLHAVDQGKVPDVLSAIEKFIESDLKYQHPDARGHSPKTRLFLHGVRTTLLGM